MQQLNAAFYHFTPLHDLPALKTRWLSHFSNLGLKGTIILAPEGINGFLAGPSSALEAALQDLRSLPGLENLRAKESRSPTAPFRKLCIKLKKEIVTFRQGVKAGEAPRITPATLAQWLDEGRDLVLLDARNRYESRLGSFRGATPAPIDHFVDFAAASFPEEWKGKPIVTFCTGGIRCEKAAPWLASAGYENVYQLEDGVLGYFEAVGGRHWEGELFVFDERVALFPDLTPTGAHLCPVCQGPVPAQAARCPHCEAKP